MTTDHDDDADLAPVTDLFGARSRRRGGQTPAVDDGSGALASDAASSDPGDRPIRASRSVARPVTDDVDAGAPVPLRLPVTPPESEWRSPVVGDGTGRSARAEQDGYGDTADATTASVFAIDGGAELDPEDAPRPIEEQRADAERLSMRALGRKGVSQSELRTVLRRNELDPDVVEHEIARLTRVGLLDDVALATDLVDRLHDRKGLGRQGVVAELRRRGIEQEAIDAALDAAADDDDDEFVRAVELAQKRAGQLRGLDRATAERRLSGFLMRKGYSGGLVRIAVERALDGGARPAGPRGTVRFE